MLETGLWNNETQPPSMYIQTSTVQTLASHDSTLSAETNCLVAFGLIQHCVGSNIYCFRFMSM